MNTQQTFVTCGASRFEIFTDTDEFLGIGRVWIGDTLVRSGRLPWRVMTASCAGCELAGMELLGVESEGDTVRLRLRARFRPQFTRIILDHSMDPIHNTGDWTDEEAGEGELMLGYAGIRPFRRERLHRLRVSLRVSQRNIPPPFPLRHGQLGASTAISPGPRRSVNRPVPRRWPFLLRIPRGVRKVVSTGMTRWSTRS